MDVRIGLQPEFSSCLRMVSKEFNSAEQTGRAAVMAEALKVFRNLHDDPPNYPNNSRNDDNFREAIQVVKNNYQDLIVARGNANRVRILADNAHTAGLGEFFMSYMVADRTNGIRLLLPIGVAVQSKLDLNKLGISKRLKDFLSDVQRPLLETGLSAIPLKK